MLNDYRVLDLTNKNGFFCGYILAHLGAEVVMLDRLGNPERHQQELLFESYARGKASLEIDIPVERDRFIDLVSQSDFLIESCSGSERKSLV